MAEGMSAPSFSLGLDLDLDFSGLPTDADDDDEAEEDENKAAADEEKEEPAITARVLLPPQSAQQPPTFEILSASETDEEDVVDAAQAPDPGPSSAPPLKRLRRGPAPPLRLATPPPRPRPSDDAGAAGNRRNELFSCLDDEVEEISSAEHSPAPERCFPVGSHSACSSSKLSLFGQGVVTSQSTAKRKTPKTWPASNASTSSVLEQSCNKRIFPKLTISSLRKIHLLDSDSEGTSSKDKLEEKPIARSKQKKAAQQPNKPWGVHVWKDFDIKKSVNMTTPALDEFLEEYFTPMKDPKGRGNGNEETSFCSSRIADPGQFVHGLEECHNSESIHRTAEHSWNGSNRPPPAHQYFYHKDARVRSLVRERLPHFVPLGTENYQGQKPSGTANLDHMSQIGANEPANGSWVNPRRKASTPMDTAKKRRVRTCSGGKSGNWFTGQDGRKVYVTKSGQELTGRIAYRQYRKESGTGFRKSRKKIIKKKQKQKQKR